MSWTSQLELSPQEVGEQEAGGSKATTLWIDDSELLSKIVLAAMSTPALLRVAAIACIGSQKNLIVVRQGEKAASEQRLDYDYGFPRGKLSWSELQRIGKHPQQVQKVLQAALAKELKEEIAISKSGLTFTGLGPLALLSPNYRTNCSAKNLNALGYKLPKRRFNKKDVAALPCIATFHLLVQIDEEAWEKRLRAARRTEGRVTGVIDVSRRITHMSFRRRPRKIASLYAQAIKDSSNCAPLIDFAER